MDQQTITRWEFPIPEETYRRVAEILSIPVDRSFWKILDRYDYLDPKEEGEVDSVVLCHYVLENLPTAQESWTKSQFDTLKTMRGTIVDLSSKIIHSASFGYTSTVTMDHLPDEKVELLDDKGFPIAIDTDVKYKVCYEGTVLRIWKWKGKVFMSTHRRIDSSRSRWGNSKTFPEIYAELGGPNPDSLFQPKMEEKKEERVTPDDTPDGSPDGCHLFMLCHPDLMGTSKMNPGKGWLFYMGTKIGNQTVENPYHSSFVLARPEYTPEWLTPPVPEPSKDDLMIYQSLPFEDRRLANHILRFGHSLLVEDDLKDVNFRYLPGESVIIVKDNGDMIKVVPRCERWRNSVCGRNANVVNRLYQLLALTYPENSLNHVTDFNTDDEPLNFFNATYDIGCPTIVEMKELCDQSPQYIPTFKKGRDGKSCVKSTKQKRATISNSRLRRLCYAYSFAVPLSKQKQVLGSVINNIPNLAEVVNQDRKDLRSELKNNLVWWCKYINNPDVKESILWDRRFADGKKLKMSGKTLASLLEKITHAEGSLYSRLNYYIYRCAGPGLYSVIQAVLRKEMVKVKSNEDIE